MTVWSLKFELEKYMQKYPEREGYQVVLDDGHCCGQAPKEQRLKAEGLRTIRYSSESDTLIEIDTDAPGDDKKFALKIVSEQDV